MDLTTLRAEIKTWERAFRAENGRDPSVQEIKAQPAIAAKYKLYKSILKGTSSGNPLPSASGSSQPGPGPRQSPSIIPKARAVKVDPPVLTSNPFSPVKNRKKNHEPHASPTRISVLSRSNPFATPSKSKAKAHAARRSLSPDPFPLIQPVPMMQPPPSSPIADSAVTRARKRLRGEPVSPSPVKEKRARVTSRAALSFTGRATRPRSPQAGDDGDTMAMPNDTILADTPMKPPRSGKGFKILFDDTESNAEPGPVRLTSSQKTGVLDRSLKRDRSRALTPSSEEDGEWDEKPKLKSLEAFAGTSGKKNGKKIRITKDIPNAVAPQKDDLRSEVGTLKSSQSKPGPGRSQSSRMDPPSHPPNTRAVSLFPDDVTNHPADDNALLDLPLIPPSPPPMQSKSSKGVDKGKGKAVPFARKKAKLFQSIDGADDESASADEDEIQVKEIDPIARLAALTGGNDTDADWERLWLARRHQQPANDRPDEPGKFDVDLPEDLQRILAISPNERTREDGEKVVRGLLYGSRETSYDPKKGGEIWDAGEDNDHEGDGEDWEGEPVPWEVGEL
ncbi:uncharacterized protein BXZ73DRAFT_96673 [Epithele typhae]|uniref:uncharacterized protein n=1 Tax=Epithele typhae TaxID=378194 RepID=UPI0020082B19|nr:uncharacterized protein BXZ73DRAFT_96673 [Epithele typhae]KAH9944180.1 hypothetical protein BXZ73DRAFT_96673 [Epithele typhae]